MVSPQLPAKCEANLHSGCLLQGRTYYPGGVKDELADAIREFNEVVRKDSRVDVVALPFRDGVSIITRRCPLFPFWHFKVEMH